MLTGVYAAALQRTQLSVYRNPDRVAINADRPDLAGLFGKQDATAQWDFRPAGVSCKELQQFLGVVRSPLFVNRQPHTLPWGAANQCMGLLQRL